jgi:hypothetical protein
VAKKRRENPATPARRQRNNIHQKKNNTNSYLLFLQSNFLHSHPSAHMKQRRTDEHRTNTRARVYLSYVKNITTHVYYAICFCLVSWHKEFARFGAILWTEKKLNVPVVASARIASPSPRLDAASLEPW